MYSIPASGCSSSIAEAIAAAMLDENKMSQYT